MKTNSTFKERLVIGARGETMVKHWLEDSGYILYEATTEGRHWVDFMCHDTLKQTWLSVEVKTKQKMFKYNATGINVSHLREYQHLQDETNMNTLLFFVDTKEKQIYYSELNNLMEECEYGNIMYPNFNIANNMVLFPLEKMETIKHLTEEEIENLN